MGTPGGGGGSGGGGGGSPVSGGQYAAPFQPFVAPALHRSAAVVAAVSAT